MHAELCKVRHAASVSHHVHVAGITRDGALACNRGRQAREGLSKLAGRLVAIGPSEGGDVTEQQDSLDRYGARCEDHRGCRDAVNSGRARELRAPKRERRWWYGKDDGADKLHRQIQETGHLFTELSGRLLRPHRIVGKHAGRDTSDISNATLHEPAPLPEDPQDLAAAPSIRGGIAEQVDRDALVAEADLRLGDGFARRLDDQVDIPRCDHSA